MTEFLNAAAIRSGSIDSVTFGEVFIPAAPQADLFVCGMIGEHDLIMALTGQEPFHHAARSAWSREPGCCIKQVQFEVDPASAVAHFAVTDEAGALVIDHGKYGIVGHHRFNNEIMWLSRNETPSDPILFKRWRIVAGDEQNPFVLFARPPQGASQ